MQIDSKVLVTVGLVAALSAVSLLLCKALYNLTRWHWRKYLAKANEQQQQQRHDIVDDGGGGEDDEDYEDNVLSRSPRRTAAATSKRKSARRGAGDW